MNYSNSGKGFSSFFLKRLDVEAYAVQQKARILLWLSIVLMALLSVAVLLNLTVMGAHTRTVLVINVSLVMGIALTLVILRKGYYYVAGTVQIVLLTLAWAVGCYLKIPLFFKTGVNTYLYLMFALLLYAAFFGSAAVLFLLALFQALFVTALLVLGSQRSAPEVYYYIFTSAINLYIGIVSISFFSYFITRIATRSLRLTEKELNKNRELNQSLEQRVHERTAEMEKAMEELSVINNNLSQVNSDLNRAQKTIHRDMKMAINVQQSFFPRRPPEVKDWDIAFTYIPMAGVSGDFYDFFVSEGNLDGVTLFDVSGHGISSGLITMYAKSIIDRHFRDNEDCGLDSIIRDINNELLKELGDISHFLTGILLRFSGNRVEYVNAAHPDLLIKRKKSGKTEPVVTEDRTQMGHFLGIDLMESHFRVVTFDIEEGDVIILYTDCLTETVNRSEEMFSSTGVIRSLDAMDPDLSAKEHLSMLLGDLLYFAEHGTFDDDLTIIVMKRLS